MHETYLRGHMVNLPMCIWCAPSLVLAITSIWGIDLRLRHARRLAVAGRRDAALRLLLTSTVRHPEWATAWTTNIARDLARLKNPFDPVETAAVFEAMIERHREVMERAAERESQE